MIALWRKRKDLFLSRSLADGGGEKGGLFCFHIFFSSLQVRHSHFKDGDLKLKCTAVISTVYWKSNEESVQGSGFNAHTAPVSESRGRTSGNACSVPPSLYILFHPR